MTQNFEIFWPLALLLRDLWSRTFLAKHSMGKSKKRTLAQTSGSDDRLEEVSATNLLGEASNLVPGSKKKRPPPPPTESELDLEKLIFGGSSSLLSRPNKASQSATGYIEDEEEDSDLEVAPNGVADDQLFMLDTAGQDDREDQLEDSVLNPMDVTSNDEDAELHLNTIHGEPVKKTSLRKKCVWNDPDDTTLSIALQGKDVMAADGSKIGAARLRRLREEVGESHINGLEYELRLRSQYEKLHPRPVWASLRLLSRTADSDLPEDEVMENSATIFNEGKDASKSINDLLRSDTGLVDGYGSSLNGVDGGKSLKARGKLKAGDIDLDRLRNANDAQTSQAVVAGDDLAGIEMIQFHPNPRASVLMTASKDRRVRLFQIDGKANALLQTIHVPDLPIQHASFHPSGSSALISGSRPFLYAYDLQAGRVIRSAPWRGSGSTQTQSSADDGTERNLSDAKFQPGTAEGNRLLAIGGRRGIVHLLDWGRSGAAGGTRIGGIRMNAPLAGFTWDARSVLGDRGTGIGVTGTGKDVELLTMSTEGSVHLWDIRNTGSEVGCVSIWNDPGSYGAKGLEISPSGRMWTVGSESGIVNIYKRPSESYSVDNVARTPLLGANQVTGPVLGSVPGGSVAPVKTIENLVTPTTTMRWNHDGQILAIASKAKKDALKLVHMPSMRVFGNWPTSGTPLGAVTAVDFSPSSQYLAIGNTRGKVLLYSLRHYL